MRKNTERRRINESGAITQIEFDSQRESARQLENALHAKNSRIPNGSNCGAPGGVVHGRRGWRCQPSVDSDFYLEGGFHMLILNQFWYPSSLVLGNLQPKLVKTIFRAQRKMHSAKLMHHSPVIWKLLLNIG